MQKQKRKFDSSQKGSSVDKSSTNPNSNLVNVKLQGNQGAGPFLATFSGPKPPATGFSVLSDFDPRNPKFQAHSQTDKMTFVGKNYEEQSINDKNVQYLVGVYDKEKKSVVFKKAPVLFFNASVTALDEEEAEDTLVMKEKTLQAREDLGLTFGSKKRKSQIRADTRNKIDVALMGASENSIKSSIESKTKNMPTFDELKKENNESSPVPAHNLEETDVNKAYDMKDVSPLGILIQSAKLLPDDYISDTTTINETLKVRSIFVSTKLANLKSSSAPTAETDANSQVSMKKGKLSKNDFKIKSRLCYLSVLLRFYELRDNNIRSFKNLREKFAGLSDTSINYLLDTFTEPKILSGGRKGCYIAVLMLSLNNWELEPEIYAKDLGLQMRQAQNYLKTVGCRFDDKKSRKNTQGARDNSGSSSLIEQYDMPNPANMDSSTQKRQSKPKAYLAAPLKFPSIHINHHPPGFYKMPTYGG
ncbi:hypothetical protein BB560_005401, partial [Smittium megazygosporum]